MGDFHKDQNFIARYYYQKKTVQRAKEVTIRALLLTTTKLGMRLPALLLCLRYCYCFFFIVFFLLFFSPFLTTTFLFICTVNLNKSSSKYWSLLLISFQRQIFGNWVLLIPKYSFLNYFKRKKGIKRRKEEGKYLSVGSQQFNMILFTVLGSNL